MSIAQPVADFAATPLTGCSPLLVNFTDLSTGNPTSWKWDLGNGTIALNQNPSATYFTPGKYKISLIIKNSAGSDTLIKEQYITVQTAPAADFSGTPPAGCLPLNVQFSDKTIAGSGTLSSWKWDFGDGTSDTTRNPRHIFTSTGTFDITLQVKNSFGCGGAISKSKYINTGNNVVANFSNEIQSSCRPPVTLNFQNLSTGPSSVTYRWLFGDGQSSNQADPSHTYVTAGRFVVRLIAAAANGDCTDTLQKEIIIGAVKPDFVSPATICAGAPLSLNNTSAPVPAGVLWHFGDGTTSEAVDPVKIYSTAGNYVIKLTADFGVCRDSVSKPIAVLPRQLITFKADDTLACKAPFTVNFTAVTAAAYSWDFGDGAASAAQNPSHTYTLAGNYNVTLIVTNTAGCSDTIRKINFIKIQAATILMPFLPLNNCVPFTYTFKPTIYSVEPVVKYAWSFGDGATDTAAAPTHVFTVPGSYAIALTVTTSGGCSTTIRVANGVVVGIQPAAAFSASPLAACATLPINFTDLSTGNVNEWLWDFGDKTNSRSKNPAHTYLDTGYFNITLTVKSSGCPDVLTYSKYIYIRPPVARFVIRPNCALPFQKTFVDSSRGADTWEWNFGDGSPLQTNRNPVHSFADTGTYPITLKVTNLATGCANTSTRNIQVIKEKASFNASDTIICKGSTIYFKSPNSPGKVSAFNWDYGDASPAQNARDSVSHRYLTAGNFTSRLIITDVLGCRDTLIKPLYIRVTGPTAKFINQAAVCVNNSVNFTDSSRSDGVHNIVEWVWNFGDGITDTFSAPLFTHTYFNPGMYPIRLKVTDTDGCADSVARQNAVLVSKPVADFKANDTASCPGSSVQFTSVSAGTDLIYLWDFGDGSTSSETNPVHQYLSARAFTVSLLVTDKYGCRDSIRKPGYISITLPAANFSLNDSISACPPFFVTFNNTSANYDTVLWDFGDGNFSSSVNSTHFYNIPGTYTVRLRVSGPGGCFDEKLSTITVKGPKGILTYTNIVGCDSVKTYFKASAKDNLLFTWDFNDGTTVKTTDSVIAYTYNQPGFYLPRLILEDVNGCQVPILGLDTVKIISLEADITALPKKLCVGEMVSFKDAAVSNDVITTWGWDFGDGTTSALKDPVQAYTSGGIYSIGHFVTTANGCRDTVRRNGYVTVIARPDVDIQSSSGRCASDTLLFKGIFLQPDTSVVTWQWNFGNGRFSALQNPAGQIFSPPGNYLVNTVATNSSGCKDTATESLTIHPLPAVSAGNDMFLCFGATARLQASGAGQYQWILPADFLSCTDCANPVTSTPNTIMYVVKGSNNTGCVAFDSITVKVKKPFTISVTPLLDSICAGESVQLNASAAEYYVWTPAVSLNSAVIRAPRASPVTNTVYKLIASDSAKCFTDSALISVSVFKPPVVDAGPDKIVKAGTSVLLSPVYSNDVVDYTWAPVSELNCVICPAPLAKPTTTTTYTITVKNNGQCSASDNVTVFTTCKSGNIFIPNTFSPNGDGINDVFYPRGTGLNRIRGMKIFNRWGAVVFEKSNFYANDPSAGWNGSVGGKAVSPDVFTFIVEIICDNNDVVAEKGNITLIK